MLCTAVTAKPALSVLWLAVLFLGDTEKAFSHTAVLFKEFWQAWANGSNTTSHLLLPGVAPSRLRARIMNEPISLLISGRPPSAAAVIWAGSTLVTTISSFRVSRIAHLRSVCRSKGTLRSLFKRLWAFRYHQRSGKGVQRVCVQTIIHRDDDKEMHEQKTSHYICPEPRVQLDHRSLACPKQTASTCLQTSRKGWAVNPNVMRCISWVRFKIASKSLRDQLWNGFGTKSTKHTQKI